jgi:hypothetical protein
MPGGALAALSEAGRALPLTAKRPSTNPPGVEGWFPYYAGYTAQFAELVLKTVQPRSGATILDPWNGSGTTTYVADRLGFAGLGFDVNPVAALVASAKLARARDAEHVLGLARRVSAAALREAGDALRSDPLSAWLPASLVGHYRSVECAILADLATGTSGKPVLPLSGAVPPLAAFLLLGLIRAARTLAGLRKTTNPTWIRPGDKLKTTRQRFTLRWLEVVAKMGQDLAASGGSPLATASECRVADARALPVADGSVDLVLTSPPYCTRIDYVVSSSFELAALGLAHGTADFSSLRRASMGTPLARPGMPSDAPQSWPRSVRSLLDAIRTHDSKASSSYYYKTYHQYFHDCELSLRELHRCLRGGGAAVMVLQTSYYKDIAVDLPQLYLDMGRELGLSGSVVSTVDVRKALAQINSRSSLHRAESSYREAVIALEKVA